jgi:hypothetical protein
MRAYYRASPADTRWQQLEWKQILPLTEKTILVKMMRYL